MTNIPDKLTDWAEAHITTLMQVPAGSFDEAFDGFIANNAHITFNGKDMSRDAYRRTLKDEMSGEGSASVRFRGSVEIPTQNSSPEDGTAGIFYSATIPLGDPKLQGVPQAVTDNSCMNMVVRNQPVVNPPPGHMPIPVDLRRAFAVNHVQATEHIML